MSPVQTEPSAKIKWASRLRPQLLKRLYAADAVGLCDLDFCDEVGMILYMRCRTFALVHKNEVECPRCHTVFEVSPLGQSHCPRGDCDWYTTQPAYATSVRNHYAFHGRAIDAFLSFYQTYPKARTYQDKMLLIDRLIHSFHVDEKTGDPTKSVASKLLEGNKKAVVRFLDELSARDTDVKQEWRLAVAGTIDSHMLRPDFLESGHLLGPAGPVDPAGIKDRSGKES